YQGPVRSPTYTLVEGYDLADHMLYHLDLYRIRGDAELEYLGIRDLDDPDLWVFVEWPERGTGSLPLPDLMLRLETREPGRVIRVNPVTDCGQRLAAAWAARIEETPSEQQATRSPWI
ncbi:MAG: tRNA (adenosine(37)-N6)-threonylcarbamoyltransferase complex ATPase subunit type 1 TsaE, partial [bacterium]